MNPVTQFCVCGLCAVVGLCAGFAIGWYVGHEEGIDDGIDMSQNDRQ